MQGPKGLLQDPWHQDLHHEGHTGAACQHQDTADRTKHHPFNFASSPSPIAGDAAVRAKAHFISLCEFQPEIMASTCPPKLPDGIPRGGFLLKRTDGNIVRLMEFGAAPRDWQRSPRDHVCLLRSSQGLSDGFGRLLARSIAASMSLQCTVAIRPYLFACLSVSRCAARPTPFPPCDPGNTPFPPPHAQDELASGDADSSSPKTTDSS